MSTPSPDTLRRLGARAVAEAVAGGRIRARDVTEAYLERIAEREPCVAAFEHLDAGSARAAADAVDAAPVKGPLAGLPIGVKDVIATHDMPTGYGSAAYAGFRPACDAPCVALARTAGAVVLGKTVATEFAMASPGKTGNPHNPAHTPGGSSSGSCAAVAAGMVSMGFGTQTAGSIIRPAAYCGVVGYKPSYGLLDASEIKVLSHGLDTLGVITRSVTDAAYYAAVLGDRPNLVVNHIPDRPVVGLFLPSRLEQAGPEALAGLEAAAERIGAAGLTVRKIALPDWFDGLHDIHAAIMGFEVTHALAFERLVLKDRLTDVTRTFLGEKAKATLADYEAARTAIAELRQRFHAMIEGVDLLMTLPAPGIAPLGLASTGAPVFNAPWTVLHGPCVTLPVGRHQGLPLGVQLVGRIGGDAHLLAASTRIETIFDTMVEA